MINPQLLTRQLLRTLRHMSSGDRTAELRKPKWRKLIRHLNDRYDTLELKTLATLLEPPTPLDPCHHHWISRYLEWIQTPPPHGQRIIGWLYLQRLARRNNTLAPARQRLLDRHGINWKPTATKWTRQLQRYLQGQTSAEGPSRAVKKWMALQRQHHRKGNLPAERVRILNRHGFVWNELEHNWNQQLQHYAEYRKQHRNPQPPLQHPRWRSLALWLLQQRRILRKGKLIPARRHALNRAGWIPSIAHHRWTAGYDRAHAFQHRFGHLEPSYQGPHRTVATWLQRQRQERNRLTPEQIRRLDRLGMRWFSYKHPFEVKFDHLLRAVRQYIRHRGTSAIPRHDSQHQPLRHWLELARRKYRNHELTAQQVHQLRSAGVPLDYREHQWEQMYEKARQFRQAHGHLQPRQLDEPGLLNWLNKQRKRQATLEPGKRQRLNALGMNWTRLTQFQKRLKEYRQYRANHPDPHVPCHHPKWGELGTWISGLRAQYRRNRLTPRQLDQIRSAGILLDLQHGQWQRMLETAREHHRIHGHVRVQARRNAVLAHWTERIRANKHKLDARQIAQLNALQFDWDPHGHALQQRIKDLLAFRKEHGHLRPRANDPSHNHIGRWLAEQRSKYRHHRLNTRTLTALNRLRIEWRVKRSHR